MMYLGSSFFLISLPSLHPLHSYEGCNYNQSCLRTCWSGNVPREFYFQEDVWTCVLPLLCGHFVQISCLEIQGHGTGISLAWQGPQDGWHPNSNTVQEQDIPSL